MLLDMYKGVANSPETTITNNINETDTIIYVLDETRIPEPPNIMVLGTGTSAETIKVLSIEGNAITVERGFQGVPKSWNAGTIIARNFTEYDYNALVENVKTLKGNTDTNAGDILSLMNYVGNLENLDTVEKSNIVLALNEIYQDLVAHKAENVSQSGGVHGISIESGIWTPYLADSSGDLGNYSTQEGFYVKQNNLVHIYGRLHSDYGNYSGATQLLMLGFPFIPKTLVGVNLQQIQGIKSPNHDLVSIYISGIHGFFRAFTMGGVVTTAVLYADHISDKGFRLIFSATYEI